MEHYANIILSQHRDCDYCLGSGPGTGGTGTQLFLVAFFLRPQHSELSTSPSLRRTVAHPPQSKKNFLEFLRKLPTSVAQRSKKSAHPRNIAHKWRRLRMMSLHSLPTKNWQPTTISQANVSKCPQMSQVKFCSHTKHPLLPHPPILFTPRQIKPNSPITASKTRFPLSHQRSSSEFPLPTGNCKLPTITAILTHTPTPHTVAPWPVWSADSRGLRP